MINVFTELGRRLKNFGEDEASRRIIARACEANGWFMPCDVIGAVAAIKTEMLDKQKLTEFISRYTLHVASPKRVGVVMAGNIPLVGFHDMLCVLLAGHACIVKPSSKDRPLAEYIVALLHEIDPAIPLYYMADETSGGDVLDAVIATGSDNSGRYFRNRWRDVPSIIRGSRSSAAILRGNETDRQLDGLARDIFSYSGLGCRNVSRIFLPADYPLPDLARALQHYPGPVNPRYRNNYLRQRAIRTMQSAATTDGGFFMLTEGDDFPLAVSEISCTRYRDADHLAGLLVQARERLQCIVADSHVPFGHAQQPALTDFADGTDTVLFLKNL